MRVFYPGRIGIWKWWFLWREKNRRTRRKTIEARREFKLKLNPRVAMGWLRFFCSLVLFKMPAFLRRHKIKWWPLNYSLKYRNFVLASGNKTHLYKCVSLCKIWACFLCQIVLEIAVIYHYLILLESYCSCNVFVINGFFIVKQIKKASMSLLFNSVRFLSSVLQQNRA